jgi:hypothetical protein
VFVARTARFLRILTIQLTQVWFLVPFHLIVISVMELDDKNTSWARLNAFIDWL